MQILETKNNLVRISFNPETEKLFLSCFVTLQDAGQMFIAQVINLESKADKHYAIIKLIFNFDSKGVINPYNGAIPAVTSLVETVNTQDLLGLLASSNPLFLGNIVNENVPLSLDFNILKENLLVCVENKDEKDKIVESFISQIQHYCGKTVIFDLVGNNSYSDKLVAGKDLKLPLNYETINFIYEKCLDEASVETKAMIQEIFLEVQNYVKKLPEKFIPFENFKAVVDAQYEETQLKELILLKNKLLKFYEGGVFAQEESEFNSINESLINNSLTVVDISKFDDILQREFISYVYSAMSEFNTEFYCIMEVDDDNTDKKLLKQIFVAPHIYSIIISPYKYKYLKEIKQLSKNLILFAPIQQQDDFAGYNVFLSKLNHREFIVYGERTQFIPFISTLKEQKVPVTEQENTAQQSEISEQVVEHDQEMNQEESVEESLSPENLEQELNNENEETFEQPVYGNVQPDNQDYVRDEVSAEGFENENSRVIEQDLEEQNLQSQSLIYDDNVDQQEVVQQNPNFNYEEHQANLEEQMMKDLDQMQSVPASEVQSEIQADAENLLSDEDLDFIEENINSEAEQEVVNQEENVIENVQTKNETEQQRPPIPQLYNDSQPVNQEENAAEYPVYSEPVNVQSYESDTPPHPELYTDEPPQIVPQQSQQQQEFQETPIVPVYPAEQPENPKSEGQFAQGDVVMHETYGRGVVNKMISYGDKVLCSIEFENAGKKLLDPAITKLEKI